MTGKPLSSRGSGGGRLGRRELLKRAAGATAAAVAAPYVLTSDALGGSGKPPASDRVTLGVIGTGGRAGSFLNLTPILAVCDVDRGHREQARQKAAGNNAAVKDYNDLREVIARPDIDAVVIVAPDHWHCQASAMAAMAGKDVYCEKPLTTYIREGRRLCEVLARHGTVFQTGSQQRSDKEFRTACELVRNGYIGELAKVTVGLLPGKAMEEAPAPQPIPDGFDYDLWLGQAPWVPYYKERCFYNFRFALDYAAGKISDWGAHHLDIAQWGLGVERGGPIEIEGTGEFPKQGIFDTAVSFNVTFTYAPGRLYPKGIQVQASDRFKLGILFEGKEGSVFVTRGKMETQPASLQTVRLKQGDERLYYSSNHWENFVDCCRTRQETVAPAEIAHRSVTLCHLANVAMLLGRKVRWDPQREEFVGDDLANGMPMLNRSRREPWQF